jgi:predicted acylesterase/phospholipase RssA
VVTITLAFVLGAGGTRGDFQVGALQFLYNRGIRPDIICGTSIGAINGLVLAEGGIEKLVTLWKSFRKTDDVYTEEPWLRALKPITGQLYRMTATDAVSTMAGRMVKYTLFPPVLFFDAVNFWTGMAELMSAPGGYGQLKSFFNLSPTEAKLRSLLDPGKVSRSGIKLRITMVGLESGEVRYVNESGHFSEGADSGRQVDLIDAVLASSSIPGFFPPVKLYSENYVDGGVREMLPVKTAISLGATEVYAIACSKSGVGTSRSFDNSNMIDITLRATRDIALDEIQRKDAHPPRGWGVDFKLIQPTLRTHDVLAVEPGMISISMAYGYMRAFDVVEGSSDPGKFENLKRTSDEITRLRLKLWKMEHRANGEPGHTEMLSIIKPKLQPGTDYLHNVSKLKWNLKVLVEERLQFGNDAVPPDVETWWEQQEQHY